MDNLFDYLRFLLAVALFAVGCYLIYDLFSTYFDIYVLVAALVSLVMAHYVKPKIDVSNKPDSYNWFDALDLLLDIPFRILSIGLRGLWKVGKSDIAD